MKIVIKNQTLRKVVVGICLPFVVTWLGICWCIMKLGHGLYVMGDWMSGYKLDGYSWTMEI